jgi:hypothetical protein
MTAIFHDYQRRAAAGRERFIAAHPDLFIVRVGAVVSEPESAFDQFAFDTVVEEDEAPDDQGGWIIVPVRKRDGGAFPDRIGVGRARNCDVVLRFPSISKLHAQILVGEPRMILDLDSANGTKVEGIALLPRTPVPLALGARIELGGIAVSLVDADRLYALLTG